MSLQILTFEIGGKTFGLPAGDIVEVVRSVSMVSVNEETGIDGIFNFRGQLLVLVDVRSKFGLPERQLRTSDHFIVVRLPDSAHGAEYAALRVDHALGLTEVNIERLHTLQRENNFAGVAKLDDGIVVIYDLEKLVQGIDFASLLN